MLSVSLIDRLARWQELPRGLSCLVLQSIKFCRYFSIWFLPLIHHCSVVSSFQIFYNILFQNFLCLPEKLIFYTRFVKNFQCDCVKFYWILRDNFFHSIPILWCWKRELNIGQFHFIWIVSSAIFVRTLNSQEKLLLMGRVVFIWKSFFNYCKHLL